MSSHYQLEARVVSVESDIRHINDTVSSLDTKIGAVLNSVNALHQQQASVGKTDWRAFIAAGSFILSIVVVLGGMSLQPIKKDIQENRDSAIEADHTDEIYANLNEINNLKTNLSLLREDYKWFFHYIIENDLLSPK